MSDSLRPYGLLPARLLCPWDSPSKNPEVGCHVLLQGIFPTQGSKLHLVQLLHCRWILYHWATRETLICCFSVTQSCLILCDSMGCSTPGFLVLHRLPELAQTHVHLVSDAIQPSHPLSSPSPAFNLPQHQDLFQWVSSLHQVTKVSKLQFQHQSFQWIFRIDFL